MKTFKLTVGIAYLAILLITSVQAQTQEQPPNPDIINLQQSIQEFLKVAEQLAASMRYSEQLDRSLEHSFNQLQALSGSRGMSVLANNSAYKDHRRNIAVDRKQMLDRLAGGERPQDKDQWSDRLLSLMDIYRLQGQSGSDAYSSVGITNRRYQRRAAASAALTVSSADIAIENVAQSISTYESFIDEIDKTQDIKASNDLIARLTAENGLLLNRLLMLQGNSIASQAERQLSQDSQRPQLWDTGFQ
tara:strand:- start:153 stop:893 length:741 start_codon:yes stop_codon:yes gene_type:complete